MITLNILISLGVLVTVSASPRRPLPSITYDTLIGYVQPPELNSETGEKTNNRGDLDDSQGSESAGPVAGTIAGYTAYNMVRSMLR